MPEVNQYLTKKSYVDTELAKKLENNNGTIEAIDSRVVFSKDQNDIAIDYINKEEVRLSDSLTNTKALLSPSGLSFIDSNNNYKTISNITNDFNQQSQTLALSQKGAYDLAATKQDVLTPGANITIAEDQQTGDLVISSTGGGTSVIANPLDQSSADLVKIKIDNITYDIPGGGGQTYNDFTGATASTAGTHGLVPAPLAGDQDKFLKADGTWAEVAGGGSGSGAVINRLYTGSSDVQTVNLTAPITNYDMIIFRANYRGAIPYVVETPYMTYNLASGDKIGACDEVCYLWYSVGSDFQTLTKQVSSNDYYLAEITGIKFDNIASNAKIYHVDGVGKNEGSISSNGIHDVHTGVYIDSLDEVFLGYMAQYAGNPWLVISNVWIDSNREIWCTILNPTSSEQTIDSNIGIFFTVITDSCGIGRGISYSIAEQKTGDKWIDGKDVYQKVIETTMANTITDGTFVHKDIERVDYIDTLIELSGIISFSTASKGVLPYTTNDGNHARVSIATTDIQGNPYPTLRASSSSVPLANQPCTIIMKYTKTNS